MNDIHLFNEKISEVKLFFDEKVNNKASAKFFRDYFGFETSPDLSCNNDTTNFELYWKDRLIDINNNGEQKEFGAKLKLGCSLRGYVNVSIYPCYTKEWKCKEDCIVLFHRLNPGWLGSKVFLQYLWWSFISYTSSRDNNQKNKRGRNKR